MSKTKKIALITGITGQDGTYLAELLLSKGYEVHGIQRHSSTSNTQRIEHLINASCGDTENWPHNSCNISGCGLDAVSSAQRLPANSAASGKWENTRFKPLRLFPVATQSVCPAACNLSKPSPTPAKNEQGFIQG